MAQVDSTQLYLTQYFTDMAEWHASDLHSPAHDTTDHRRLASAFYRAVADHIGALQQDDLRLVALGRLTGFTEETGFSPGPRVSAAIADVGQFVEGSPEPFLEYLVHAALDDQLEFNAHTTSVLLESVEVTGTRV